MPLWAWIVVGLGAAYILSSAILLALEVRFCEKHPEKCEEDWFW